MHLSQSFFTDALTFMALLSIPRYATSCEAVDRSSFSSNQPRPTDSYTSASRWPISAHANTPRLFRAFRRSVTLPKAEGVFLCQDRGETTKLPRGRRGGLEQSSSVAHRTRERGQYPFYYPTLRAQLHVASVPRLSPGAKPAQESPLRRVAAPVFHPPCRWVCRDPSRSVRSPWRPFRAPLPLWARKHPRPVFGNRHGVFEVSGVRTIPGYRSPLI